MAFYNQVQSISGRTLELAQQNDFAGYDPFDSLNSAFLLFSHDLKKSCSV
ncbi:MAG: hypothetical protein ACJA2G_000974 [Cognaticolwellia sp.]|jgi:hypothetical protein